MAFTYSDDLLTDRDRVRFYLGDTREDDGSKPDTTNFSDAEIDALIDLEGNWRCAVAAGFEALASDWQSRPVIGVSELGTTHARVAEGFASQARLWRERCEDYNDDGALGSKLQTATMSRVDSYSS